MTARAFHQRNHAVEKTAALFHRHANDDAIAQHACSASDRAAVAATLADDRRRFARDRGFIDARDSFNHVAVRRNDVAGFANHDVALLQHRRGNLLFVAILEQTRHRFFARPPQAGRLGFTAAFRHRFGEIGEEDGEPQPDRELSDESAQIGRGL